MESISFAEVIFVHELVDGASHLKKQQQSSWFRVIGRLSYYDAKNNRAQIDFKGSMLDVDTSLVDPNEEHYPIGGLIEYTGEIMLLEDLHSMSKVAKLKARSMRTMEGLDIGLFTEALNLRKVYTSHSSANLL
mmetsp:Transcript_28750/g.37735  ORF Transcript_28750/g.37735 Transcript_28750/m.37735 type:complete len:133 (+) Transcript_28750:217-615(+)|eukprot:CAMPEP_0117752644 /NCGR_PEP_ID=MMETSP0947-20121206/11740_1 /TAXON_ID=44440 /ORGANISM="Chattonella subsalsa, Strain CCMP2191" /LENGTH=132 /DNA_ID=CAMNT_0005571349 /DNA_START=276 /DNA_END=674 /DNA_ORIENTATION=+